LLEDNWKELALPIVYKPMFTLFH